MTMRTTSAVAVAGATAAPALVWLFARVAGVKLEVLFEGQPPEPVVLPGVIVFALVASLAGWVTLVVLRRFTQRGVALWTGLAIAVLLVSLVPPLTAPASTATQVTLVAMHLAVAAVLIPGLRLAAKSRTPAQVGSPE